MIRKRKTLSKKVIHFFNAACDIHRKAILDFIHNNEPVNACRINKKVKISQPTISHHLKILNTAGVIDSHKEGKEVYYTINKKNVEKSCKDFLATFCGKDLG